MTSMDIPAANPAFTGSVVARHHPASTRQGVDKWFSELTSDRKIAATFVVPVALLLTLTVLGLIAVSLGKEAVANPASDVSSAFNYVLTGLAIAGACTLTYLIMALRLIRIDIVGTTESLVERMNGATQGDYTSAIPHIDRIDQYGDIARALQSMMAEATSSRETIITESRLRRESIAALSTQFEQSVGDVVGTVASAATQLNGTAGSLATATQQTKAQTELVASSVDEAAKGTTAAAAASDEFAMSIGEISQQASVSAQLARAACDSVEDADAKISHLIGAATEIEQVVELIQSIAKRTNLLALNASIEAARGGEAGKGFAVVASEVKDLATQTSKATSKVVAQIAEMQSSTTSSVGALRAIGDQVRQLETTAVSIASAVDQQSVAGQDLARSIDLAARSVNDVSATIFQVQEATRESEASAGQVLQSAAELERQSSALRQQADSFIRQVRR